MNVWEVGIAALFAALIAGFIVLYPETHQLGKGDMNGLTPQQRIDNAFQCLELHQRGYRCD